MNLSGWNSDILDSSIGHPSLQFNHLGEKKKQESDEFFSHKKVMKCCRIKLRYGWENSSHSVGVGIISPIDTRSKAGREESSDREAFYEKKNAVQ
jgi:hypothetical protein